MENNGKGMSIFYGVIGVATLVITIIGATFAYFSATTNSAEDAVSAAGATLSLGFTDNDDGKKADLIPIDVNQPEFNIGNFVGGVYDVDDGDLGNCKDVNNNNICSIYEFTISNPGTNKAAQRVYGSFVPKDNEFTNLKFAVFKGTTVDVYENDEVHNVKKTIVADDASNFDYKTQIRLKDAKTKNPEDDDDALKAGDEFTWSERIGWDVDGTAVTAYTTDWTVSNKTTSDEAAARKHVIGNPGDLVHRATLIPKDSTTAIPIPAWEQVLDVGESMTYTIVMWIDETGSGQNEDQSKSFAGGINFTTEGNGTGVTGVLSATSR